MPIQEKRPTEQFRRSDPRYERVLDVEITTGGATYTAKSKNISLGGMLLEGAFRLTMGTQLQLRFQLPTQREPVEVTATVRWVVGGANGLTDIGVAFQGLRAREVWALNRYFQLPA